MKRNKTLCRIAAALLAVLCLAGCSAKNGTARDEAAEDAHYSAVYDGANGSLVTTDQKTGSTAAKTGALQNQKLIRTMDLKVETDDLDTLLVELDVRIQALGGYVENKSVRNGGSNASSRYRYADLTIRIPVDALDTFINHVNDATNVISYTEDTDDITLNYVATQSRITALETEQTRLLELLSKAENMTDLLQIEARLTDVRTELEEVTSRLRLYDNLVDYGTVRLSVTQVQEYTAVEEETLWQRIGSGLKNSWNGLCGFVTELFVFVVVSLPYLIPLGAVATAAVLLFKARKRKRAKKSAPQKPEQESCDP